MCSSLTPASSHSAVEGGRTPQCVTELMQKPLTTGIFRVSGFGFLAVDLTKKDLSVLMSDASAASLFVQSELNSSVSVAPAPSRVEDADLFWNTTGRTEMK